MKKHQYIADPFAGSKKAVSPKKAKEDKTLPPGERLSYQGNRYPDSTEGQWTHHVRVGWVHESELRDFKSSYAQCEETKEWCSLMSLMPIRDMPGKYVHRDCLGKSYSMCAVNGRIYTTSNMIEALDSGYDKSLVCKTSFEAYFTDFTDGKLYHPSNKVNVKVNGDVKYICDRTLNNSGEFSQCQNCGVAYPNADVGNDHEIPGWKNKALCKDCVDTLLAATIIASHDNKDYPPVIRKSTKNFRCISGQNAIQDFQPVRLFGVEVETEYVKNSPLGRAGHALALRKVLGSEFVSFKHDGSLSGTSNSQGPGTGGQYGFEMVTGPCCIETHRENWPRITIADGYKRLRAWDTTTCGLHIHVSRDALTLLQIGRILAFMNHPNNKGFVQKIAGRSEERYCKYFPKKLSSSLHPDAGDYNERRRVAVNLQNAKTIEFRIFRGTVNPRRIIRCIEFCDALCDFCHPSSRSLREAIDPFEFIKFVEHHRKTVMIEGKPVTLKTWPMLYGWFVYMQAIKTRKPTKHSPKPLSIADDEPGEQTKYVPPSELIAHSVGFKL